MSVAAAMNPVSVTGTAAQYPVKKRKRPQSKKEKDAEKETVKSNPSKRHRDRLNFELENLSQLIPLESEVVNKLDKLSVLRIAVAYLRNKNYYAEELDNMDSLVRHKKELRVPTLNETESSLALQALHGFLIVVTQDFNVMYVSETIQNYLGYPQCDVINQSILELVHADDRNTFMRHMHINHHHDSPAFPEDGQPPTAPEYANLGMSPEMFTDFSRDGLFHRSFICRLRCLLDTSSGFLALHFTGHLRLVPGQEKKGDQKTAQPPGVGLFLLASPLQSPAILEIRTKNFIFRTKHRLDYTPLGIDAKGKIVLGYTEDQLRQRSGYEFIHSADMMHCADAHTKLMRLGESGLTVFRLLHKDNRWVWVTASAKLIFRDGRPEFIIATQRPIMDQEGEEHMKKRTNAFRFDFTGSAILYGEVNPIGTRGGPEKNPLKENLNEDQPLAKKPKISNSSDIDRKSLFGAQAMQRMDIYAGNLPIQSTDIYAKSNFHESAVAPPSGPDLQPCASDFNVVSRQHQFQDSVIKDDGYNTSTNPNRLNATTPSVHTENHQLLQNSTVKQQYPVNAQYSVNYNHHIAHVDEPPRLYHPPLETKMSRKSTLNPLKRPYPDTSEYLRHQEITLPEQVKSMASVGKFITSNPNNRVGEPIQNQLPLNQSTNCSQIRQESLRNTSYYFDHNNSGSTAPIHPLSNQKLPNLPYNHQRRQPSVIESMTINSFVNIKKPMRSGSVSTNQMALSHDVDCNLPVPDQYGETQLVACQNNMIQFDLQKVASDYQTTDPLSKVQEYLHNNPSHAMAIATGQLPEAGMPKLQSQIESNYFPSSQLQPQTQKNCSLTSQPLQKPNTNDYMQEKQMASPFSSGKSINSISSPLSNQPCNISDDDGYLTLSISSLESFPPTTAQREHELGLDELLTAAEDNFPID